jgi:hypothetical protein
LKGIASFLNLDPNFTTAPPASQEKEGTDVRMVLLRKKKITICFARKSVNWQTSKITDLINIIIPFFNKYPILGMKNLDFEDFKKVCEILTSKEYLISSGRREQAEVLNQILKIKSGMNLNRVASADTLALARGQAPKQ